MTGGDMMDSIMYSTIAPEFGSLVETIESN